MFTMKFCVNKYCEEKILVINRKIIKNHIKKISTFNFKFNWLCEIYILYLEVL
jgi:hypothetical protein